MTLRSLTDSNLKIGWCLSQRNAASTSQVDSHATLHFSDSGIVVVDLSSQFNDAGATEFVGAEAGQEFPGGVRGLAIAEQVLRKPS